METFIIMTLILCLCLSFEAVLTSFVSADVWCVDRGNEENLYRYCPGKNMYCCPASSPELCCTRNKYLVEEKWLAGAAAVLIAFPILLLGWCFADKVLLCCVRCRGKEEKNANEGEKILLTPLETIGTGETCRTEMANTEANFSFTTFP